MAVIDGYAMEFLVYLITTLVLTSISIYLFRTRNKHKVRLPPGPLALPIIGHLHLMSSIPHQSFQKLSNRYGPLIHILLGSVPCIIVSSPEVAKEVLKSQELDFTSRPMSLAVNYLTYDSADFIFAPYGPYWRFMKKLCMTELLNGQILNQFVPMRKEELRRFLKSIFNMSLLGKAINVRQQVMRLTNNTITRMMMNTRCSETEDQAEQVIMVAQEATELAGTFNLSDYIGICRHLDLQGFGRRMKDTRRRFDNIIDKIIMEHEEARSQKKKMGSTSDGGNNHGVKTLLDLLLDICEDEEAEVRLTKSNVKAFLLDLFLAGTDTSAVTIEWAMSELINNPSVLEKAREEMDLVVGKSRLVEESDIPNLPYLQAIVKETLRLHPGAPLVLRASTRDCKLLGYDIPGNARTLVNVWAIGRDPKYWDNPLQFQPERFMMIEDGKNKSSQIDVRGQHYQFLPFGSGRRICPGLTLGLQTVQMGLASMIQCFEWKVGDGKHAKVDMEESASLTLPRAHHLICVPVPRLNPLPLT
ncbi:PREDICTED: cytochrome P450 93A2-like [Nelumbo nucifera]|uniref:Cytochrome P450 93A2-like n=2 Tax=Nelumbo nucifera TaxID=4432 RepID=A0A1U8A7E8_NELNU|nr:PREDICTED: cytochrome P450 93A2-like [Nelumbo nucifera]DAD42257.1 TPA_asm: hypothetical protein HUJ06_000487 [Nelumbo nucifera]